MGWDKFGKILHLDSCDRSNLQKKLSSEVCQMENGAAGELRGQRGFGDSSRPDARLCHCGRLNFNLLLSRFLAAIARRGKQPHDEEELSALLILRW